ncbi:hypothetical protein [Aquibacillus rhizosphaerae]|uniref:DUF4025 domain-containing protein n=1 Tax=Aquibacillus rhizosphaerae TaxID=3051431 RepID=A0ABT7L499_9BACI|nr:hypothetical protein [Aquibacillus sp. LR5S19]MDL4839421.1 hypothetical protein [Aquibacillus sp. LR5S19]
MAKQNKRIDENRRFTSSDQYDTTENEEGLDNQASIDTEIDKRHNENARESAALEPESPRIDTDHL